MRGPVQSVEVSYFLHATEDEGRVRGAVASALGLGGPGEEATLEGHFGNRIVSVEYHLTGDSAQRVVQALASGLEPRAKQELRTAIADHLDEHLALYIRLDKQMLMEGRLGLAPNDGVRVRVKPRLFMVKGGAAQFFAQELGLGAR